MPHQPGVLQGQAPGFSIRFILLPHEALLIYLLEPVISRSVQ